MPKIIIRLRLYFYATSLLLLAPQAIAGIGIAP